MKIIKPGVLPNRVLTGKCRNCKCEVEAHEKECKEIQSDNGGWGSIYYQIECPTVGCGEKITVSLKKS